MNTIEHTTNHTPATKTPSLIDPKTPPATPQGVGGGSSQGPDRAGLARAGLDRSGLGTSDLAPAFASLAELSALDLPAGASQSSAWGIEPGLTFLNHGSYGAMPRAAMRAHAVLRERLERDPVRFYKVDLERLLDQWRERLGEFVNCRPEDLAPMPNATVALCTIIANTQFQPGDEVVVTDHEYMSLHNELDRVLPRLGARKVTVGIPFPINDPRVVVERYLAAVGPKTRLCFISHVTSASSLVLPVGEIVRALNERGIDVCVDGAHAPGQVPVDIRGLAPTYYVGSGHKWLSGPKGTGFLYVRADRQAGFRPVALSSRAHKVRPERPLFLRDFDYVGTDDYTNVLALPACMAAVSGMVPGSWPAVMRRNHDMAMLGREIVCRLAPVVPAAPESMIGSMASVILPEASRELPPRTTLYDDPLQDELVHRHRIVTPVWRLSLGGPGVTPATPASTVRVLRLSAHLYNTPEQYEALGRALATELDRERSADHWA